MADTITHERRIWNISHLKGVDTSPGSQLRTLLNHAGFRFGLNAEELRGKPDIILSKCRAAIFVHGCFWHRHKECRNATMPSTRTEFWYAKFDSNTDRDGRNQAALRTARWTVFTVWEHELKFDAPGVVEKLSYDIRKVD